jgi:predicted metal-dependent hydrolase
LSNPVKMKTINLRTGLFKTQKLEYQVRFSKRSRKSRIKVDASGVEVILPEKTNEAVAEEMLRQYSEWVLKKIELFEIIRKRETLQKTVSDQTILFHGKKMQVIVQSHQHRLLREPLRFEKDTIIFHANGFSKAKASEIFQKYLKEKAREEIIFLTENISQRMGTSYSRITIRDQRTRWGACSARKSLSFNWRLVMAPPEVMEYVVIHELAHLLEMNHSIKFWKIVEKFCPDFKKRRLWLKKNANYLRPDFISLF